MRQLDSMDFLQTRDRHVYADQEQRMRGILAKITYKPTWTFELMNKSDSYLTLYVRWRVPDVMRPDQIVELVKVVVLDTLSLVRITDDEVVRHHITAAIRDAEMHEMNEWFCFEGKHVRDPHPKLTK